MKFSVIIPVYNVENYIEDCIKSVLNQTYDNFELIIVNDGSTDKSKKVIQSIKDKRIRFFDKENTGVSDTRNYGISKVEGDYFIFVDSDDTINKDLLLKLNETLLETPVDLVKYQIQMIEGKNKKYNQTELFTNISGEEAFEKLIKHDLFVTPVTYCYKTSYFKKNKYKYAINRVHEDFGLTPLVVVNAKSVTAIDYLAYNYYVRNNSIMTTNHDTRIKEKNDDSFYHFDYLLKEIDKSDVSSYTKELFKSYLANGLINRCVIMEGETLDDYINELKKKEIYKYLLTNTLKRKVKKQLFKTLPNVYISTFVKK